MQSDNQLVRKIQHHRNREAANILVERYYKEIYAYVFRQTGDREMALDLTQEIFIVILQGIHSFDEKKAGFRTWAYRVASNRIVNHYRSAAYRKRQMEVPLDIGEARGAYCPMPADGDERGTAVMDMEELIIQKETIGRVMMVVAGFDSQWIQIFQKKCFEEKTFRQIAGETGLAENTVKTRFYSMLKRIRKEVMPDD